MRFFDGFANIHPFFVHAPVLIPTAAAMVWLGRRIRTSGFELATYVITVAAAATALVAEMPQYRLEVSPGVLEIYSPKAREDTSNLLNAVIDNFEAKGQSPRMESFGIYQALMDELHQPCCQIGNALESGDSRYVTLNLQRKSVYQLLDALVTQNGESLWVPVVPPQKLSVPETKLWEVYGLGPGWEQLVMSDLQRIFPPEE